MDHLAFLSAKLHAMLQLERQPVGVKLVYSKEEFDADEAKNLVAPMEYCVAIKSAGLGHSLKFTKENSGCGGSTVALGFQLPADSFYEGADGCRLGLFKDPNVAAKTTAQMKIIKKPLYGVIVKPLGKYVESNPDVVIVVARAREIMRVVQGYTCTYGIQPNMCPTGNQAICVECTAYPILTGELNLSMFCSGTRYLAKWKDSEAGVGIPYEKLEGTIAGIRDTVNATEMDNRKAEIIENLKALEEDTEDITMGSAYYLGLQQDKFERVRNRKNRK